MVILAAVFLLLAAAFAFELWGQPRRLYHIPLVEPEFTKTTTIRQSYPELVRAEADLSDFECYICHEEDKPPVLKFDAAHNLIIPKEHSNIVMGHGSHNRNNNCYNCHDEQNLERLQTRDGRALTFAESHALCGSCHGPSYREWEAGAHGRTGGYWNRTLGGFKRQICVDCHDPHHPAIPPQKPAPGPHPLHGPARAPASNHTHE